MHGAGPPGRLGGEVGCGREAGSARCVVRRHLRRLQDVCGVMDRVTPEAQCRARRGSKDDELF